MASDYTSRRLAQIRAEQRAIPRERVISAVEPPKKEPKLRDIRWPKAESTFSLLRRRTLERKAEREVRRAADDERRKRQAIERQKLLETPMLTELTREEKAEIAERVNRRHGLRWGA